MNEKNIIKRIFLVRHGESKGNIDPSEYITIGDKNIPLTKNGENQSFNSGKTFAKYIHTFENEAQNEEWRFWESPYLRATQTTDGFLKGMESSGLRLHYDRRQHPLLIEQHFGLFDGLTEEQQKKRFPIESAHISRLFAQNMGFMAKPPQGESRYDVYIRSNLFKETLWRDADHVQNFVIVSHGLTIRAFAAAFLNNPMDWVDNERNPDNCSIQYIEYNSVRSSYKPLKTIYSLKEPKTNPVKTFRDNLIPGG